MRIESIIENLPASYNPADRDLILRAYKVAEESHAKQSRASGEPYVNHCLAVAAILTEMHVPTPVIAAGLLHDTVEDTDITIEDIRRDFGEQISILVGGVTKLTQLPRVSRGDQQQGEFTKDDEGQNVDTKPATSEKKRRKTARSSIKDLESENLRKTFLAMGEDVNVVLIKLADRLHNMRTLSHIPKDRRERIAQETLDIFAPLANRLGIWQMKWELEDLGFRYINPQKYKEIADGLATRRSQRESEMQEIKNKLEENLTKAEIDADITARPKHIYSIHRKMVRKDITFDMIHDIRGVRILVPDIPSCYSTLGVIHTQWRPIPSEFDDYIASPKDNFYRSLHTSVVYDDGKNLEVQIRTKEMHQSAEYGIASHWRYKEGSKRNEDYERRIIWLRTMMEWRRDVDDAKEFLDSMKTDVFQDRVYVFTPKGDIIDMPAGSTPIDFAYHVHTDIGHRCRGAKVSGRLVSLDYILKTGDKVEVLTAKRGGPSRDWINPNLGLVKTQRARSKIRRWFKRQARDKNIIQGKSLLEKEIRRLGLQEVDLEQLADEVNYRAVDQMYEAIGCGDIPLGRMINHLTLVSAGDEEEEFPIPTRVGKEFDRTSIEDVRVVGLKGLLTRLARCCNPAPEDSIIGYITRGRGATIHRQDCPNILRIKDRERLVRVSWGEIKRTYPVPVRLKAYDRDGLMKDVSTLVADESINMTEVKVTVSHNMAIFDLTIEIRDVAELSRILDRLENLPNVLEAHRVQPG